MVKDAQGVEHAAVAVVNDVQLYSWDIELLQPRRWLNDALIAFVFEHMSTDLSEGDRVVLLEPTVSFSAGMVPPEFLAEMLSTGPNGPARLKALQAARLVLLPVNDNQDTTSQGGGHWSLLAFRRLGDDGAQFEYYDSCNNSNIETARAMAQNVGPMLTGAQGTAFRAMPTPQQSNGHDCGLYVISVAQALCSEALEPAEGAPRAPTQSPGGVLALTPAAVDKKRAQVLGLIEAYMYAEGG